MAASWLFNPRDASRQGRRALKGRLVQLMAPASRSDEAGRRSLERIFAPVRGGSVALVGNAQSILGAGLGAEIDAHDFVVRMNRGVVQAPADQGARTDCVAVATDMPAAGSRSAFSCRRFIWTNPRGLYGLNLGFAAEHLLGRVDLAFIPPDLFEESAALLGGVAPSTGLVMAQAIFQAMVPTRFCVYGFDWKATKTFYRQQVTLNNHAWEQEKAVFARWAQGGRLVLR